MLLLIKMTVPIAISWFNQSYKFNLVDTPLYLLLIINLIALAMMPYIGDVIYFL